MTGQMVIEHAILGGSASDEMIITPLGAGNEVGRSCIILQFKGRTIMLDCGIHPAYSGLAALPFFDQIDPAQVDLVLVTHFHLDHAASLPYFMEKTLFRGKVYMTHPTRAIYKWLLSDYVKVSNMASATNEKDGAGREEQLYTDADLAASFERIIAVDFQQQVELDGGIRFTALNAGHVLGAAMFLIEIAGVRILYTGDYSREADRHLIPAQVPSVKPDVMICESTYGVGSHQPRAERERRFTAAVHEIVRRGGRCLIPVFALGTAQELLLILDEFWQASGGDLLKIPIYYASPLARKCIAVYQTYINMMNERIRQQAPIRNPFIFRHINYLKNREAFRDSGPCVVLASPGMLQNGFSRELLEQWCSNRKNGLIIPGYVVEGTMGKHVLTEPKEITAMSGATIPFTMSVDYFSFSAHVDFVQNSDFIDHLRPPHLVLVHGEQNEMYRLRNALVHKYGGENGPMAKHNDRLEASDESNLKPIVQVYTPRNCESVRIEFRGEKYVKIVGELAKQKMRPGEPIEGILVGRDFEYQLVHPKDLPTFTSNKQFELRQRQAIRSYAPASLVEHCLVCLLGREEVFKKFDEKNSMEIFEIKGGAFILTSSPSQSGEYFLEWESDGFNDMIADSIVSLILSLQHSRAAVKLSSSTSACNHGHMDGKACSDESHAPASFSAIIKRYLIEHFGEDVHESASEPYYLVPVDDFIVRVSIEDFSVSLSEEDMKDPADSTSIERKPKADMVVARVSRILDKITSLFKIDHII